LGPEGKRLVGIANRNGPSWVVMAWEHALGPQCWSGQPHNRNWNQVNLDTVQERYPLWHPGVCHFLFCDGHAVGLVPEDIEKSLFYVTTPPE
jgi:prepilin-type processing-associated H-X9-DG protein